MKIAFLIANVYGMGGTIRATTNLANGLIRRHEVEIVSMARGASEPFFRIDPQVRLRDLTHGRGWKERPEPDAETQRLETLPAEHVPPDEAARDTVFNALSERALRDYLANTDADVVVATRPGLNSLLALFGTGKYVRIGQEHLNLGQQPKDVLAHIRDLHVRLDGLTVLTDSDRRDYARFLGRPESDPWLFTMPNAMPEGPYARSRLTNPIIAAAGRLIPVKQYPKLVRAFAAVAEKHPDWQLRIYGSGQDAARIRSTITEHGLNNHVVLMGRAAQTAAEFAKASIVVCSSKQEGLSMVILEGFAVGVPVVSFDCPHGPRELIDHERTGLLVADQDVDALAAGMLRLVEDEEERRRMGAAAVETARRYHVETIVERWETYLAPLLARTAKRSGLRRFLPW